ncbi:4-(cytidine 5'-diphospho)-2-C-methyl-D-erythritol kinase [Streptomyces goshikiensis]|uniref:4-(cytidine 5'-diphospho)-2-C-methyl-D-erythritol kinase n=1 Tax=Streptomyces goshikiensis TaxID=1942 RepID=UPI002E11F602|nr:4-(cytidine 5'-diphospho)-2-C-methyl-D-erythritol kinase [Streptomyces goshikiensis]WSR99344.1 4-(cytidine 5'-diphospho)-2-C-methyl-D-erythritol kinase [Streptomyces goshikiensis]WSX99632.1 4-(cytidine 5'-diphospho)-2-C-methyl-D-erythritol kinase [Streptomyces goshikiensis]
MSRADAARSVTVRVPAKVNVQLAVGAARPDGFHDLANVFLAVSLYDEVTVTPADELTVTCAGPDADQVPLDRTNLVARAAETLAARSGLPAPAVHIHIAKNIPVAGGMAGGSADGAGALVACDALWGLDTPAAELLDMCAELGSDVPFSLVGGAALGTGRGEILTPVEAGAFHWVFAVADGGLSTPAVFREFDRLAQGREIPAPEASPALLAALASGDPEALAATLVNDLQPAALSLRPGLAEALAAGTDAGALAALVSGSGPTTAFLVRDAASAAKVASALEASGLCRATRTATSPAPGATLL